MYIRLFLLSADGLLDCIIPSIYEPTSMAQIPKRLATLVLSDRGSSYTRYLSLFQHQALLWDVLQSVQDKVCRRALNAEHGTASRDYGATYTLTFSERWASTYRSCSC